MNWLTSIISNSNTNLTLIRASTAIGSAFILGVIIASIYSYTTKSVQKQGYKFTIMMLPTLIAMLIYLINNNVATAFSLAGAFSLIRFRSETGSPNEIVYIFFALVVGLASGLGYAAYGMLFTLFICGLMLLLNLRKEQHLIQLKIVVPENVSFEDVFKDVLMKYTSKYELQTIKTREFGSLYELNYQILLQPNTSRKQFIDELRVINSNLSIQLNRMN